MGGSGTTASVRRTNKWLGFVTAMWVEAVAGTYNTYADYSVSLKAILNLNQVQLNNLSGAKDVGKALGLVAGLASDYLPPWMILLIGSVEGLVGYGVQWLVVSHRIRPLPYWQMCVFLCMGGNSMTWMSTAAVVTCMRNFPTSRGPVVGILKGYVGLSAAIFTIICRALFASNPSSLLLMLTLVPGFVCVTAMVFLKPLVCDPQQKEEGNSFSVLNVLAIVTAVYLLAFDVTGEHRVVLSRVFVAILCVLLATPLIVPAKLLVHDYLSGDAGSIPGTSFWTSNPAPRDNEKQVREPLLKNIEEGAPAVNNSAVTVTKPRQIARKPAIGEDHTIFQAIQKFDFWLLFVAFLCGFGTAMVATTNLGQIGLAMGFADVSVFVSLISVWGFFGSIAAGSISEHFLRKAGVPRPVWMAASQVLMIVGYIIMAIGMHGCLYIGSVIVGICCGVRLSVSFPTASDLFGLKYYGMIYNFLLLSMPIANFLFSGLLAGILYDIEAAKDQDVSIRPLWKYDNLFGFLGGDYFDLEKGKICVGVHCYRLVFLVMAGVCVLGFGLDVLLSFRMKKLYWSISKCTKATDSQQSPHSKL